jgi:hypothetical protein
MNIIGLTRWFIKGKCLLSIFKLFLFSGPSCCHESMSRRRYGIIAEQILVCCDFLYSDSDGKSFVKSGSCGPLRTPKSLQKFLKSAREVFFSSDNSFSRKSCLESEICSLSIQSEEQTDRGLIWQLSWVEGYRGLGFPWQLHKKPRLADKCRHILPWGQLRYPVQRRGAMTSKVISKRVLGLGVDPSWFKVTCARQL